MSGDTCHDHVMPHGKSHVVHLNYMAHIEPCEHDVINGENKIKRKIMVMPSGQGGGVGGSFPHLIHKVEAIQKRGEMRK